MCILKQGNVIVLHTLYHNPRSVILKTYYSAVLLGVLTPYFSCEGKKKREKPKCSERIVLWVHLHLSNSLSTSVLNHMVYGYQCRQITVESEANFDSRKGNENFSNKSHALLFSRFSHFDWLAWARSTVMLLYA